MNSISSKSSLYIILIILSIVSITTADKWVVKVGDGLKFDPPTLTVNLGDTVIFNWLNGPHDVVQSDGKGSCNPMKGGCTYLFCCYLFSKKHVD